MTNRRSAWPAVRYCGGPWGKFHFLAERDKGGSPAAGLGRGVAEGFDEGGAGEDGADHFALDSDAASVNDAEGLETERARLFEIRFDNGFDVAGRDGVEVEDIGDGDADRFVFELFVHSAVVSLALWTHTPNTRARWRNGRPKRRAKRRSRAGSATPGC